MEKAEVYYGNIYWLLEGLKILKEDYDFDRKISSSSDHNGNSFHFYDCIIFNEEKEDSLLFQDRDDLFEFFSNDKCELILKLMKLYAHKHKNIKLVIPGKSQRSKSNKRKISSNDKHDIMLKYSQSKQNELITDKICCNLYLQYKDGSVSWILNFEVKKLLFQFKFLENYTKIRIMRFFPIDLTQESITTITHSFTYIDSEDKIGKMCEDLDYDKFCSRVKKIFYDKYGLNLKKMDIDAAFINGTYYIMEVKELKFEKFDTKHVQLECERLLSRFQNKHKYKQREINKNAPNIKEIESLLKTMLNSYEGVKETYNLKKFLSLPPKDKHSDGTFKILKPEVPFTFSELLEEKVSVKDFAKYCSNKLYKNY